jgi:hypothetical protein
MNERAHELSGGIALDDPHNALRHISSLYTDGLGVKSATPPADNERVGNDRYAIWRVWEKEHRFLNALEAAEVRQLQDGDLADLRMFKRLLAHLDLAADSIAYRAPYSASGDILNPTSLAESDEAFGISVPHTAMFRNLGTLNVIEMRLAVERNDWPEVVRRVKTGIRLARHLRSEPYAFATVLSLSIERTTLRQLRLIALEYEISIDAAQSLLALLRSEGEPPSAHVALLSDKILLPSTIVYVITDRRKDHDWWSLESWRYQFEQPRASGAIADGLRYLDAMSAFAASPRHKRATVDVPSPGSAEFVTGGYGRIIDENDAARTEHHATRIILLLERHHALTGEWPAALEDIMPHEETLDPNTLAPFGYTLTPGGPFPFSLLAPPEADFIREEDRDFTKPRVPIAVQNNGGPPPS